MMPDPQWPRPLPYGQTEALDALLGVLERLRADRSLAEQKVAALRSEISELDRQGAAIELVLSLLDTVEVQ